MTMTRILGVYMNEFSPVFSLVKIVEGELLLNTNADLAKLHSTAELTIDNIHRKMSARK